MSKFVDEEVARVIRRRRVKTFGDKIKEFFEGLAGKDRDAIMGVSGEAFGAYAAGWDEEEKLSARLAKQAGIVETPLTARAFAELKIRWSPLTPAWIADAGKLGIDGEAAIAFYRGEVANIDGGK